jgi:NAD+ synthase
MDSKSLPEIDPGRETDRICSFVSRFVEGRQADGLALGLSGGLDSSVVAALASRAIGPERVHALMLSERDSSKRSIDDAREQAEHLGIRYRIQDLTSALGELGCYERGASGIAKFGGAPRAAVNVFPGLARKGFLRNLSGGGGRRFQEFVAFYRIKHRLRMVEVYREAEEGNLVAASCANRTEFETGFFVRYGDDAGDIAPIKHLYKTQVFRLGRHLGIPDRILEKSPSPDLFAGMADEKIMGMRYAELDSILWCMSQGLPDEMIMEKTGSSDRSVSYVREIVELSGRYREPPADLIE